MSSREITKELAAKILLHGVIVAHKDVAPQGLISGKHLRWGQCPVPPIRLVKMEVMLKFCVPILHWFVDGPCQSMVIVVRPLRLAVVCYPGGRNPPCLVLTCSSSTHDQLVRHGERGIERGGTYNFRHIFLWGTLQKWGTFLEFGFESKRPPVPSIKEGYGS